MGSGTGHVRSNAIIRESSRQHAGASRMSPLFISNLEVHLEGALSPLGSGSSTSG